MGFSNTAEEQALRAVYTGSYVGLATSAPTDTDPGTEVSAAEYQRVPWTFDVTQGDPTEAVNDAPLEYPAALTGWGTVTHAILFSEAVGGDYLGYAELRDPNDPEQALPKEVSSGDILRIPTGALVIGLD